MTFKHGAISSPKLNIGWLRSQKTSVQRETLKILTATLTDAEAYALYWHWPFWAREDQFPPPGDWTSWMMMGGRGAGKTRAGAEWVRARVEADLNDGACRNIALVGETYASTRAVMVEGPSGLLAISPPDFKPRLIASRQLVIWPNGAEARLFSAERPDALRGPQFDAAWCDEIGKWRYDEATFDMLQFGLRLGQKPRQVITTTPRPSVLISRLMTDPKCVVTRASTYANEDNLAPGFIDQILDRYHGTRLGLQEIEGQLVEEANAGLWSAALIDRQRCKKPPPLKTVIVALDPPVGSGPYVDACGVVVLGVCHEDNAYVLADCTVQGLSPNRWASHVVDVYRQSARRYLVTNPAHRNPQ
ncbi:MAG: hypothetical protein CBD03_06155 [Rhizobiales bacterium TMED143]|nr:hypothetical protein [Rhodobiaceae bacterium]OUV89777.1 MAG: hypothetical protein CBD03_06155 [Rhizobiales bacterium TMED143]